MEPARPTPETEVQAAFVRDFAGPAVALYRAGDRAAALDRFATGVFGPDYRAPLDHGLPGGFEQALADADTFFGQELPAVQQWELTRDDAARVTQPVLAVLGEHTAPTFPERLELLSSWLPRVESFELPNATHLLHVQNPRGLAEALADFFVRHSVSGEVPA
jgi:pimeloyl-ACP methyl ester carboxylesterase